MFNQAAAKRRLQDALLGRNNRRVVDCWLAQWRGDVLPAWQGFSTATLEDLQPGMVAFELHPDGRLICIQCGEYIRRSTGMDLTGQDWVALAVPEQRESRLAGYRRVAAGAVGHCLRYGEHTSGDVHYMEEVLLPFAEVAGEVTPVLAHLGWRPVDSRPSNAPEFRNSRMIPDEVALISLGA